MRTKLRVLFQPGLWCVENALICVHALRICLLIGIFGLKTPYSCMQFTIPLNRFRYFPYTSILHPQMNCIMRWNIVSSVFLTNNNNCEIPWNHANFVSSCAGVISSVCYFSVYESYAAGKWCRGMSQGHVDGFFAVSCAPYKEIWYCFHLWAYNRYF